MNDKPSTVGESEVPNQWGRIVTFLEQLEAAPTQAALDDVAVAHKGYWTDAERRCYERRTRAFKAKA